MIDETFLLGTELFHQISTADLPKLLHCLCAQEKAYQKGNTVFHAGDCVKAFGLVLAGSINIEADDLWGNKTILGHVEAGSLFAETYACIPSEPLMVNAVAGENCRILFFNAAKLLSTCQNACACHTLLIRNLLQISAQKNLALSRRSLHTSSKSIRGRLLSYLSEQAKQCGSQCFTIPFNRQQLADYLSVDRSALSNELSKMRHDGLLTYTKSNFSIRNPLQ